MLAMSRLLLTLVCLVACAAPGEAARVQVPVRGARLADARPSARQLLLPRRLLDLRGGSNQIFVKTLSGKTVRLPEPRRAGAIEESERASPPKQRRAANAACCARAR